MNKFITLKESYTFDEALKKMYAGECLGIRPKGNTGFVEMFKPPHYAQERNDYLLRWHQPNRKEDSENECHIRVQQLLNDMWQLVILDHREFIK